ncbi:PREDICTED: nucleoporin Ndc1 [Ceratosolen solmsi marchali]|uniref:Nucleoporin Ndc1 n=1 Tax=Ceratosolen solmsi marchali TaxID=326594 RepID=A0AAJ7DXA3_9HYME|nr:PREDICTED: nucleoporin Ndc1 [Ceratosolen solmsi marchali]
MDKTADIVKAKCKELLVKRMFLAVAASIIVHFILMSGVILVTNLKITHPVEWIQDTWNVITCLRMWTYFLVFSMVIFLQGIICSKDYINPISYASSRFVKFCHIFTMHNLLVGSLFILLGGILAWLHLSVEDSRFSSLIKNCETLQGYCLVEEHYFLLLEGFWIGFYFFTNFSYLDSRNLQFCIIPRSKLSQVKRGIQIMITNTLLDAVWPTIYFLGFYSAFGNYCRSFFTSPFSLSIEDIPLDKISRLLSLSLIFYAWLHAVLFVLIIQSMHLFFQAYLTEWIPFVIEKIELTEKSKISLADALGMEKFPILRQLGYLDLVTIAQKDKTRRSILFTLSQPGGHPYNWNNIIEKSLSLIKKFSEGLNSACSNQKEENPKLTNTVPISCAQTSDKLYNYHMRNLVSATPTIEQFENKLRHAINDAQTVIWAADAISTLATVSLNEDPYGIVQKDLPEIIEVLLNVKQSLDKLQKLNISIRKPMSDDKFLKQTLTALRSAVRRSLYRIVSHFKNYIDDLALSPLTVDHLQPFFTYRE